ncbi:DNA-binding transcriptional ArsR family regulator [Actinoplanes couchii]|nr:DNA-binding transcriptional ArsR family regulator [Actinoplanes couchii]
MDSVRAGNLAGAFKALGDPVRLRLLSMIASAAEGEICVCDLSDAFPLTGPTISHHLKILREAGLVHGARRGTWVYYRAIPAELTRLAAILDGDRQIPAPASVQDPASVQSPVQTQSPVQVQSPVQTQSPVQVQSPAQTPALAQAPTPV